MIRELEKPPQRIWSHSPSAPWVKARLPASQSSRAGIFTRSGAVVDVSLGVLVLVSVGVGVADSVDVADGVADSVGVLLSVGETEAVEVLVSVGKGGGVSVDVGVTGSVGGGIGRQALESSKSRVRRMRVVCFISG